MRRCLFSLLSILHILSAESSAQTFENLVVFTERLSALFPVKICVAFFFLSRLWCVFQSSLQQARELVVKLIRDKDLGDFRVGRADFGSKMGGNSLDVSLPVFFFSC